MSISVVIPRKTLHNELATLLRTMIVKGELRPGNRISEQRLCTRFGVSRTPLREALKVLSAEGLVHLLPNKGATVVRVTRKEVEEIIPILGTLSALAAELACHNLDEVELARIQALHRQMLEHYRAGQEQPYSELNRAIHDAFFLAAKNRSLIDAYQTLEMRLQTLMFMAPKTAPQWAEAVDDHERMMKALETRDVAQFTLEARHHIRHKAEVLRTALESLEARTEARMN
jgi:DNA-binding GntR family transcriptional regulator